jgi:hypothetical protein
MAKRTKSEPTENPEFEGVIQHFLKTPPTPHVAKDVTKDKKVGRFKDELPPMIAQPTTGKPSGKNKRPKKSDARRNRRPGRYD